MPPTNRASYLPSAKSPLSTVSSAPYTTPSTRELVIKTAAVAINPADVLIQKLGILVPTYPAILGCDVIGEVVEVHSSLADVYSVGDRVIGSASCMRQKEGVYCYSGFQEFVVLKAPTIAKIPAEVESETAVVLPLGINTASSCLFAGWTLGLAAPSLHGTMGGQGKTVIIWGASSSVGSCGVQMASHAGYDVVGIASERNHEMVKSLGATRCFDQKNPALIDDLVYYLKKGKDVVGAYDAVSHDDTLAALCEVLDRSGGRKLVASVKPGAEAKGSKGVKIVTNFTTTEGAMDELWGGIWEWLGTVINEGKIRYMPEKEVVGKGLEDVQKAVDLLAQGVSAKKLVVLI